MKAQGTKARGQAEGISERLDCAAQPSNQESRINNAVREDFPRQSVTVSQQKGKLYVPIRGSIIPPHDVIVPHATCKHVRDDVRPFSFAV